MPDLTQATPPVSVVIAGTNGLYQTTWGAGTADPVSAVLMHDNILNEYVLDPGTKSGTDWIVTFPTKRFYVNVGTGSAPKLLQRNYNATTGSCDDTDALRTYDREEHALTWPDEGFDAPPPLQPLVCWGANVLTFDGSDVLGSANSVNVNTAFANGWVNLSFFPTTITIPIHSITVFASTAHLSLSGVFTTGLDVTYYGLPVIGTAVQTFDNGTNSATA